jgi:hypothetical protein
MARCTCADGRNKEAKPMSLLSIAGVIWGVLAAALLALATYHALKSSREDDSVHLVGGDERVEEQTAFTERMLTVERWTKILAVVVVVYGLVVLGIWGYSSMFQR